jgi:branched-subunit amino acid permease
MYLDDGLAACVEISCPITEASNPTGITLVVCRLLQMYLKQERIFSILS